MDLARAFDAQPTWNGAKPVGGETTGHYIINAWEPGGGVGYLDFGPDWAKWHITQVWTLYGIWRKSGPTLYADMWWSGTIGATRGADAASEKVLKFNSQPSDGVATTWIRDVNATAKPIVPKRRYLMLKLPNPIPVEYERSFEYALAGYKE
jgi:hypothetical protein